MTVTYRVRRAEPGDVDAIARITVRAFAPHRPGPDASPAVREAFARYLASMADPPRPTPGVELYVALDASGVVGAGRLLLPGSERSGPEALTWPTQWAVLRQNAVDPAHRGRGVGRALWDVRIARAREVGAPALGLHTARTFGVSHAMVRRGDWRRERAYDFVPAGDLVAEAWVLRWACQAGS